MEKREETNQKIRLTQFAKSAGCAAKIAPDILSQLVGKLPAFEDENLLVGVETSDDGAVYRVSPDMAFIQTLDFFPPVVDDPFTFGQISAANALSDIYAMGGEPKLALNIVAFPNCLGAEVLGQILAGGAKKVREAGAVLAGGHSINDEEPKYGLCVTGYVHPNKIWKNCGACPGDVLILTKPLGTGLVNTAVKAEMAEEDSKAAAIKSMCCLNKYAAEILKSYTIHSCTDVTGFSLAGHGMEMARGSQVTLKIMTEKLPILRGGGGGASMGLVPEGTYRNKRFCKKEISMKGQLAESMEDLLFDPQTSGGLLVSVPEEEGEKLLKELRSREETKQAACIGYVEKKQECFLEFC